MGMKDKEKKGKRERCEKEDKGVHGGNCVQSEKEKTGKEERRRAVRRKRER